MAKQKSLFDYDERYRLVFSAGASHWNDPRPNQYLSRVLDRLPERSRCIEFGCGEGYQAYFMASRGHTVTAIDLSPAAIEKAINHTPDDRNIRFLVGDVTDPASFNLGPSGYDLAVDIGCLHMMTDDEDRTNYLNLVYSTLRSQGIFCLLEGLAIEDISPDSDDESGKLAAVRQANSEAEKALDSKSTLPRTIETPDGPKEIPLPVCPAKPVSLHEYTGELKAHGFLAETAEQVTGSNMAYEAFLIGRKP